MYVKIHGNRDYVKGNTQSCRDLVNYLEKENEDKDFLNQDSFFNQTNNSVDSQYVINSIDNNKKGLKEKDAKFFMITINPSEKELKHLSRIVTSGKMVNHVSEMTTGELERYNNLVRDYSRQIMDNYARAFNRDITGKDLLYYGKVEQERHFKGTDKEVKEGKVTSGELKPGLQTHVHIVVSRKDIAQKHSLSPLANSKGSDKHKLNGKSIKVGFDRDKFVKDCESEFDKMYQYQRKIENSYEYYKYVSNPTKGLVQSTKIARQAITNPEIAAKNLAVIGIDNLSGTKAASHLNTVTSLVENPESAKDMLVNNLEQMVKQLLPPELRAVQKVAENVIKPVIELGTGGLEI
jgi:hypothetical protein